MFNLLLIRAAIIRPKLSSSPEMILYTDYDMHMLLSAQLATRALSRLKRSSPSPSEEVLSSLEPLPRCTYIDA